jgi:hypothetical protein
MNVEELPHVDPKSPNGYIKASRAYLERRFAGTRSWILHSAYVAESASRNYYWFRDTPEVRKELGMEES